MLSTIWLQWTRLLLFLGPMWIVWNLQIIYCHPYNTDLIWMAELLYLQSTHAKSQNKKDLTFMWGACSYCCDFWLELDFLQAKCHYLLKYFLRLSSKIDILKVCILSWMQVIFRIVDPGVLTFMLWQKVQMDYMISQIAVRDSCRRGGIVLWMQQKNSCRCLEGSGKLWKSGQYDIWI